MAVSRARTERGVRARKSAVTSLTKPIAPAAPLSIPNSAEIMRLKARGRAEADMIATALQDAPPLDRDGMGSELYPFNDIASSEIMQEAIDKIVRRRVPDSPWIAAHKALMLTDENGRGYAEYVDAFRDVSFMAGVDYALRSLPAWWATLNSLTEHQRDALGVVIEYSARHISDDGKGGAR